MMTTKDHDQAAPAIAQHRPQPCRLALWLCLAVIAALWAKPADASGEEPVIHFLEVEVEELSSEDDESSAVSSTPLLLEYLHEALRREPRSSAQILNARRLKENPNDGTGKNDDADNDLSHYSEEELAVLKDGSVFLNLIYLGEWESLINHARTFDNSDQLITGIVGNLINDAHLMLATDAMALAVAIGESPTNGQTTTLGELLKGIMERSGERSHFLERLRRGIGPYGGDSSGGRARAAGLLLAAGMELEAGPWLPAIGDGRDLEVVSLHARHWLASALDQPESQAFNQCLALEQRILDQFNPHQQEQQRLARQSGQRILTLVGAMAENPAFYQALMHWLGERSLHPAGWDILRSMVAQRLDRMDNTRAADSRVAVFDLALALATMEPFPQANDPFLTTIAFNWLAEARYARSLASLPEHQRNRQNRDREAIDLARLAALIPSENILQLLDPDLGDGLRLESAEQVVARGDFAESLQLIDSLAEGQAERALHLANQALRVWVQGFGQRDFEYDDYHNYRGYRSYRGYYSNSPSIPLSRARQIRRLKELAGMVKQLEEATQNTLDIDTVVAAFVACHSPAEIFQRETMSEVFGNDPSPAQRQSLAETMRQRLAGPWRQPQVQQQAKTQRSDQELVAEILRGYTLAADLVSENAEDDWRSLLLAGQISFDHAEFLYGQEAPFEEYAALRESAFTAYAAADRAAAAHEAPARVMVWARWFDACLGASDLAYLSRQHEADQDHLNRLKQQVESTMSDQPQLANQLARVIHQQLRRVPPHLVHRYISQASHLLNKVPAAADIHDSLAVLNELLDELALEVAIQPASAAVGQEPFAILISLGHSVAIGREAQHFDRYLSNDVYVDDEPVNFRDDFTKHIRDVLAERCEIIDLRLYNPGDPMLPHPRQGWRSRPLAWAIVKAHDPSVDRIDSLRLDMDFDHQGSTVIMPITGPLVTIDATTRDPQEVISRDLHIVQTMSIHPDDPDLIIWEIQAHSEGLTPELSHLVSLDFPGFEVISKNQGALVISEVGQDESAQQATLRSSRQSTWELRRLPATSQFVFPEALVATTVFSTQQRGSDGLVDSDRVMVLADAGASPWWWLSLLLIPTLGWLWYRRHQPAQEAQAERVGMQPPPQHPSPLAAIQWLRAQEAALLQQRGDRNQTGPLLAHLRQAITTLETAHYQDQPDNHGDPAAVCAACHALLIKEGGS